MRRTAELARSPLWRTRSENMSVAQRVRQSYERAKSVVEVYQLTADDILNVTPRYWEFHTDPILAMDGSVGTLLTIHYNLCAGTLAKYTENRPEIKELLRKMLAFELSGQFCLTELGHGLDVSNMETTATLLPDGSFELNTPTPDAAKYMPPTGPIGIPVIGVVFARLIVKGEDWGIKPFVVQLSDGQQMCYGIESKALPPRGGAQPVKHALTYFRNVQLPSSALLAQLEKPKDPRGAFFDSISRVISGCLSMGAISMGCLEISTYIGGQYSLRRRVIDASTGRPRPIISFSTQYIPVLTALSQTYVMKKFAEEARTIFASNSGKIYNQHFVAAVFKAGMLKFATTMPITLGDRCGAQGLHGVNQLPVLHADFRGAGIAEGDILTISIRFAMEVLLGKMKPPTSPYPDSILAKHERSMIEELRHMMASASSHRDPLLQRRILPHCQPLMEAISYRMAYDAAMNAKLDSRLIDMFVASIIKMDPAWYAENGIRRSDQAEMEETAAFSLLPDLPSLLDGLDVEPYVTAPIVTDQAWNNFVSSLETTKRRPPRERYNAQIQSRL